MLGTVLALVFQHKQISEKFLRLKGHDSASIDIRDQISREKTLPHLGIWFQHFQESGEQQEHLKRDLNMCRCLLLLVLLFEIDR